jgi:calcium-dependent protein kinase
MHRRRSSKEVPLGDRPFLFKSYQLKKQTASMGSSSSITRRNKDEEPRGPKHSLGNHLIAKRKKDYLEDYTVVDTLGEGAFGKVYKVRNKKDKELYALKVIDTSDEEEEWSLQNEVNVLRALDHPNVVKIYEVYEYNNSLAIALELCSGGDLYKRQPYTELQAKLIVAQTVEAIAYLHSRSVIHRDLKMENVLFENETPDSHIKVVDFGLSRKSRRRILGRAGTSYTMSPEAFRGESDKRSDMWSIGVMTFIILSGEMPFVGESLDTMKKKIFVGRYSFDSPAWKGVSHQAKEFVRHLLKVEPGHRLTAEQALQHPWLRQFTKDQASRLTPSLVARICANVEEFSSASEFHKLALQAIAKRSNSEEIIQLRDAFLAMDPVSYGRDPSWRQSSNHSDMHLQHRITRVL